MECNASVSQNSINLSFFSSGRMLPTLIILTDTLRGVCVVILFHSLHHCKMSHYLMSFAVILIFPILFDLALEEVVSSDGDSELDSHHQT